MNVNVIDRHLFYVPVFCIWVNGSSAKKRNKSGREGLGEHSSADVLCEMVCGPLTGNHRDHGD